MGTRSRGYFLFAPANNNPAFLYKALCSGRRHTSRVSCRSTHGHCVRNTSVFAITARKLRYKSETWLISIEFRVREKPFYNKNDIFLNGLFFFLEFSVIIKLLLLHILPYYVLLHILPYYVLFQYFQECWFDFFAYSQCLMSIIPTPRQSSRTNRSDRIKLSVWSNFRRFI